MKCNTQHNQIAYNQAEEEAEQRQDGLTKLIEKYVDCKHKNGQYILIQEHREVLHEFIKWMDNHAKKIRSLYTIANYIRTLSKMSRAFKKPYLEITDYELLNYIAYLKDCGNEITNKPLKPQTLNITKMYIRSFYKWLNGGESYPEQVKRLEVGRHEKRDLDIKDLPTFDELQKLILNVPCPDELTKVRNQAIVAMMIEMPYNATYNSIDLAREGLKLAINLFTPIEISIIQLFGISVFIFILLVIITIKYLRKHGLL